METFEMRLGTKKKRYLQINLIYRVFQGIRIILLIILVVIVICKTGTHQDMKT